MHTNIDNHLHSVSHTQSAKRAHEHIQVQTSARPRIDALVSDRGRETHIKRELTHAHTRTRIHTLSVIKPESHVKPWADGIWCLLFCPLCLLGFLRVCMCLYTRVCVCVFILLVFTQVWALKSNSVLSLESERVLCVKGIPLLSPYSWKAHRVSCCLHIGSFSSSKLAPDEHLPLLP